VQKIESKKLEEDMDAILQHSKDELKKAAKHLDPE